MIHVTCRLTAKNWHQLRNPTLGNRGYLNFFYLSGVGLLRSSWIRSCYMKWTRRNNQCKFVTCTNTFSKTLASLREKVGIALGDFFPHLLGGDGIVSDVRRFLLTSCTFVCAEMQSFCSCGNACVFTILHKVDVTFSIQLFLIILKYDCCFILLLLTFT